MLVRALVEALTRRPFGWGFTDLPAVSTLGLMLGHRVTPAPGLVLGSGFAVCSTCVGSASPPGSCCVLVCYFGVGRAFRFSVVGFSLKMVLTRILRTVVEGMLVCNFLFLRCPGQVFP